MKRLFIIFITFAFLFNAAGYYFTAEMMQHTAKRHAFLFMNRRNDAIIRSIRLSKKEFEYVSHQGSFQIDHEFVYEGNLYDLKKLEYEGNDVILYCYHDAQEQEVVLHLTSHVEKERDDASKNSPAKTSLRFNDQPYEPATFLVMNLPLSTVYYSPIYFNCSSQQSILCETPPPRKNLS